MAGGGGGKQVEGGPKKARIEIIPLIDVIFFLLATFVLFTLSLDKLAAIDVTLPQAVDAPSAPPDENMVSIQVSEGDTIYWKMGTGTPQLVAPGDIPPLLDDYKTRVSPPKILISGDTRAKFGAAVMVLDAVRAAGIEQVSVATTTTQTGK